MACCAYRELQVIWGGVLQLFIFFPTFKHFRLLNIAALAGTTMTAIFLLVIAAQQVTHAVLAYATNLHA